MNKDPPIFDAHLDLAMNVRRGRDITKPAREQPVADDEIATVGLPDLRAGHVQKICATIFCEPAHDGRPGYTNPQEAFDEAATQLSIYRELFATDQSIDATILLEGAECIRTPDDLPFLRGAGVRIIGLSWRGTRYSGGTGEPGPLTAAGKELVAEMHQFGFIHDASHLAEESFWNLVEIISDPLIASHSNCRSIVGDDPKERHLSDEMIKQIVFSGGVVGINFYDRFLLPSNEYGSRRAKLSDVVAHIRHVCDLAGNANHVGIGTDMDGGLGREQIPEEIQTSADLPKLASALLAAGFRPVDARKIMFENWNRFFSNWFNRP